MNCAAFEIDKHRAKKTNNNKQAKDKNSNIVYKKNPKKQMHYLKYFIQYKLFSY